MDKQDKIKQILENAVRQADALTATQAKELIKLLASIVVKGKEELNSKFNSFADSVSQETYQKLQEAISILTEKANDNQLEVRQLTNKQRIAHESKMSELEALIQEFRNFELPEPEEVDREGIIQETLSRIPEVKEYELLGENVVDSINSLEVTPENQIDAKHIKNLPQSVNNIVAGAGGRLLSQMNDVDITGLAQDKVLKWDATRNIWVTGTVSGGGSGDVVGPASATDNALARYDTTTGKLIQNSTWTLDDNDKLALSTTNGEGLSIITSKGTGAGTDNLLYLEATNSAWDRPILRINNAGTSGGATHIRLDGVSPQIEWVEDDQVSPAGKFETQVQGDIFYINGRNAADNSFENSVWFLRPQLGGNVGLGVNPYNIEKLTIGETTGGSARIAMRGTSAPTADTNYGKLWADSTSFLPKWMDSAGTSYNVGLDTATQVFTNKRITFTAGTTTAGTAPIKLTSGTSMTTAEAGAIEFTTDNLFFTITTGAARKRILMANDVGGLTTNYIPYVTTNGRLTNNANLQWDPTNARLGVGAVPSYRLHVIDTNVSNSGTNHTTSTSTTFTPTGAAYTSNIDSIYAFSSLGAGTAVDSAASAYLRGGLIQANNASSRSINTLYGVTGQATNGTGATGTINSAYGIHGYIQNDAGTINNAFGAFSEIRNVGVGTINAGVGLYVDITKSAGTITTVTGFKMIDFRTTVTNLYGVLTYGNSKFGGFNTLPTRVLESEIEGSATNTIGYPLRIIHSTSGTATTGFGVGQEFQAESASGTMRTVASFDFPFTDATNASEDTDFVVNLIDAGTLSERVRVTSDGDVKLQNTGAGLYVKEGSNATMGIATLVAGTVTINTTKVTANSRIFLTRQTTSGTLGTSVDVTARTAGTSFTITSNGSVLDTSTVAWMIVEPA